MLWCTTPWKYGESCKRKQNNYKSWPTDWKALSLQQSKKAEEITDIIAWPMKKNRSWAEICKQLPVFSEVDEVIQWLRPWSRIWDFGAGMGETLRTLEQRYLDHTYIWVDHTVTKKLITPKVRLVQANLEINKNLPTNMDCIISAFTSMYLKNPIQFLQHIQDCLSVDGQAWVHLWYTHQYKWWKKQLEEIFKDSWGIINYHKLSTHIFPMMSDDSEKEKFRQQQIKNPTPLSTTLHAIVISLNKDTKLPDLTCHATQWFMIPSLDKKNSDEEMQVFNYYQPRSGDKWYMYTLTQQENTWANN